MQKQILNKQDMQGPILEGFSKMAAIVAQTLGPGGLPILIQREGQKPNGEPLGPMITKDGVTVAKECSDPDPRVDVVLQAIKDICEKTNKMVGDGTTSSLVLGNAILIEAQELINKEHSNPQTIRNELEASLKDICAKLDELSIPCNNMDMVEHVATISANGDKSIGSLVRKAYESVGAEGVITVDTGSGKEHTIQIVSGYQFQKGAEAQERFFNNETNTRFEAENTHIIIYDGRLQEPKEVSDILNEIYKKNEANMPPVMFIANEFDPLVIQMLLITRAQSALRICAVKGPHATTVRTQFYEDMATYLGGYKFGNGNRSLGNFEYEDIGIAGKVVVDKYTTTLYDGQGTEEAVLARIDQLKAQKPMAESAYDESIIADRISYLGEGIAKIGVGGLTELEIKEAYHRIEDAVNASKVAIEDGIIPGGGVTLMNIAESLEGKTNGEIILKKALQAPMIQISLNLGRTKEQTLKMYNDHIKGHSELTFDGVSGQIVPALKEGIIDPVKVTKSALAAAVSISALLCTTGGAIIFVKS